VLIFYLPIAIDAIRIANQSSSFWQYTRRPRPSLIALLFGVIGCFLQGKGCMHYLQEGRIFFLVLDRWKVERFQSVEKAGFSTRVCSFENRSIGRWWNR